MIFYVILVYTFTYQKNVWKMCYIFYVSFAWKMILRTTFESLIIHWINVLAKRFDFTFAVDSFYIYTYFRSSNWNGIKSSVFSFLYSNFCLTSEQFRGLNDGWSFYLMYLKILTIWEYHFRRIYHNILPNSFCNRMVILFQSLYEGIRFCSIYRTSMFIDAWFTRDIK